jgi:uncharacterized protein
VVLAMLNGAGFVKLQPKAALYAADLTGGLILGVGIALAGACPGTTLAQIGAGYRDALFTLVGGLCGAVAFSYAQPILNPVFLSRGDGKIIFTDMAGIPFWVGALIWAAICALILVALERWRPWRDELGGDVDGNLALSETRRSTGARVVPAE